MARTRQRAAGDPAAPERCADAAARRAARHPLTALLAERLAAGSRPGRRADGARMALAIEGGGTRGSVSAGMALALHELGLLGAFDAVYGASAGAISAAWLLSSRPEGLRGWADQRFASALIRKRNLLRGRPLVDVERLIERIYVHEFPLDYASILANPLELHPLATDVDTGEAVDLHRELTDCPALRLAIRASAALPVLAGAPITLGGRRYFDAGLAESVPFRQALRDGATHVLVLRSRPAPAVESGAPAGAAAARVAPSLGARLVARVALRRHPPQLRASYLCRAARLAEDDRVLAAYDADGTPPGGRAVLSLRPGASMPAVSRLETDSALLKEAFEIGRATVYSWHAELAAPMPPAGGHRLAA